MQELLLTPGPTPIPESVLRVLSEPIPHHRTKKFEESFARARAGLKNLFGTQEEVLSLACTGTGAMEASVANLFSPGEKVLVVNCGKFGARFGEISRAYGLDVADIMVERGKAAEPARVAEALKNRPAKALLFQANETSTGMRNPVRELAKIARDAGALSVVDGITGVGVFDLPMDAWGLDVLMTASQKALMLPPGLAFIALSKRAQVEAEKAKLPRYYFDLREERKMQLKNQTAWTPAISLLLGLVESLNLLERETLPAVYRRHEKFAHATREGIKALGLRLFAPDAPSPAITSVHSPSPDGKKIPELMQKRGVVITGGQDELAGKIFRLSHLGCITSQDLERGFSALEESLLEIGHSFTLDAGLGAFRKDFAS